MPGDDDTTTAQPGDDEPHRDDGADEPTVSFHPVPAEPRPWAEDVNTTLERHRAYTQDFTP